MLFPHLKKVKNNINKSYRPVFFSCFVEMCLNGCFIISMLPFFAEKDLILPKQSEFRSRHSCTNQLLSFTNKILSAKFLKRLIQFDTKVSFSSYNKKSHKLPVSACKLLGN